MKVGVNQFCFPSNIDVADALKTARRLGFETFEVCMTDGRERRGAGGVADVLDISGYQNRLLNTTSTDEDIRELKHLAGEIGIAITGVGGILSFSIYPLTSTDSLTAKKSMDAVRRMLDAARILGSDNILVIPGLLTEDSRCEEAYSLAQERIAQLADYAPEITLSIENVWNNMLYSPLELNHFIDEIGKKNVGIYFDVANARRFGYPQQWIYTMGKRIKRLHCKDYRMSVDNINGFTNILDGDVNYPAVIAALKSIGYEGELVVELIPPANYQVERTLQYARETLLTLLTETD